jgi:hypothetical protein
VILFVLFGGSVGAVVFLHTQYGWQAVLQVRAGIQIISFGDIFNITSINVMGATPQIQQPTPQVLNQEMTRNLRKFQKANKLTTLFWNWIQVK